MRNSAVSIDNLANHASEAVKRRNGAIFAGGAGDSSVKRKNAAEGLKTALAAIHSKPERRMTKTEERFFAHLKVSMNPARVLIVPQPTRFFRFDNGDTYTPDFITVEFLSDEASKVTSWEVKGGYRGAGADQGYERFYRAKERFSRYGIDFVLVEWDRKKMTWRQK